MWNWNKNTDSETPSSHTSAKPSTQKSEAPSRPSAPSDQRNVIGPPPQLSADDIEQQSDSGVAPGWLPQHQEGEASLQAVRDSIQEEFSDQPAVLELSDRMSRHREQLSQDNPELDSNQYIYRGILQDATDQFAAATSGVLDGDQSRTVPASSVGPFANILATNPPQSDQAKRDALGAAVVGFGTQMAYGSAPGNPFSASEDNT